MKSQALSPPHCFNVRQCFYKFDAPAYRTSRGGLHQSTIELDARDEREAEWKAKARFCDIHGTHDWCLHAERLTGDPADFLS
jgi:hypothetical protein